LINTGPCRVGEPGRSSHLIRRKTDMKVLVVYDGTLDSKAALRYGIQKVREYGGELTLLNVFPRHQFIDYGAGPKAEAITRLEALRHVAEARMFLLKNGRGFRASLVFAEGNIPDEVLSCSKTEDIDLIVAGPALEALVEKACTTDIVSAADEEVPELVGSMAGNESIAERTWRSL
jgi:hypothetical protein